MRKLLVGFAILGIAATPALSQANAPADQAPVAKPQTVKKIVCQRIEVEQSIGSRLNPTTKICKQVEVPAPVAKPEADRAPAEATAPQGR